MSEITKELAFTSSNLKSISEQFSKSIDAQDKARKDLDELKNLFSRQEGAVSSLKVISGIIVTIILTTSGWALGEFVTIKTWIAQTEQWKISINGKDKKCLGITKLLY